VQPKDGVAVREAIRLCPLKVLLMVQPKDGIAVREATRLRSNSDEVSPGCAATRTKCDLTTYCRFGAAELAEKNSSSFSASGRVFCEYYPKKLMRVHLEKYIYQNKNKKYIW
jgi:hypothetical protein